MSNREILNTVKERGLLLEKEIYELINSFDNVSLAKTILEQLEFSCKGKIITRKNINGNVSTVRSFVNTLEDNERRTAETVFLKLGLSIEAFKSLEILENKPKFDKESSKTSSSQTNFKIFYADTLPEKKLEVSDFTGHFRSRFAQIQKILMSRRDLQQNLVSMNKISSERKSLSIIGIVTSKNVTKNKNIILHLEDLTGEVKVLVKHDSEVFSKADELQLDDIIGVKASGNRDILFAYDIIFPDAFLLEKTRFDNEANVVFLSDVHCGSNVHLGKSFQKFLDWLNGGDETAKKIKYIFFTGDNVDGVGIFPGQEEVLELKTMHEQYTMLAGYLRQIPPHITMFMCPGQHDASRVADPQPIISKKYASALYEIENLVMVTSPCTVKLMEGEKEFKVLMYHGASLNSIINEISELREIKAHKCPAKAVKHLLKRRHLAPSHGVSPSIVYIPNREKDPLVISEVPDVITTGDLHRSDIETYNGVLIITSSCWQAQTQFEEKIGNIPDPCKVPILNLKTRELKIYDFTHEEEANMIQRSMRIAQQVEG